MIRRTWKAVLDLWEDDDTADRIVFDPVHVAAVVLGCIFAMGVIFWDLWALLVFEGGLFTKVVPFFQVLLTNKTLNDSGYEGSPYALGIFEGWIVNLTALIIGLCLVCCVGWVLRRGAKSAAPRH